MALKKRDKIQVHLVESDINVRSNYRNAIREIGYKDVAVSNTVQQLWKGIEQGEVHPDVLIICTDMDLGLAKALIRAIREREIGVNPFMPILATVWGEDISLHEAALSHGAHDFIKKPASKMDFEAKIDDVLMKDTPFIASRNFIGPKTHVLPDDHYLNFAVNVPSVPKLREAGLPAAKVSREIEAAWTKLRLARNITTAYSAGVMALDVAEKLLASALQVDDGIQYQLNEITDMCSEAGEALPAQKYAPTIELLHHLGSVVGDVKAGLPEPKGQAVQLLKPLSQAVCQSVRPGAAAQQATSQILTLMQARTA